MFILVLALLVFGPRRLPEIGRTIGRAMGELRRATSDLKSSLDTEIALEDEGGKGADSSTRLDDPARPRSGGATN